MNKAQAALNATKANLMNQNSASNAEDPIMPPIMPFQNRMIIPYYKQV